jgi:hypothetical protein
VSREGALEDGLADRRQTLRNAPAEPPIFVSWHLSGVVRREETEQWIMPMVGGR